MTDFIVYHNPDEMGCSASEMENLSIITGKTARNALGGRVWLITGEGHPRRYFLRLWFIATDVESSNHPQYHTRVRGVDGALFDPMRCLDSEPWFEEFRRSQGNFSLGFQPITDPRFIAGLEAIASTLSLSTTSTGGPV